MGEEAVVLGGQNGLAQDERDLVIGHDAAVLARQFNQDLAVSVADDAGGGRLETDERLDVGHAGSVEIDVVDEPCRRNQRQRHGKERDAEEHDPVPPQGFQPCGQAPGDAQPRKQRPHPRLSRVA